MLDVESGFIKRASSDVLRKMQEELDDYELFCKFVKKKNKIHGRNVYFRSYFY